MGGVVMVKKLTTAALAFSLLMVQTTSASAQTEDGGQATSEATSNEGGLLVAAKAGGIIPFNGMDPFVRGGLELGWVFSGQNRTIAALLDISYTRPGASGSEQDDRLAYDDVPGEYDWEIEQHELVFQPTFLYRFTSSNPLVPFVGLGPRIYLLETISRGKANDEKIQETSERSTKFGAGLPFGAEYQLGPGGLFAEGLLEWAPLDHRITGDSSLLAGTLQLGYRAIF